MSLPIWWQVVTLHKDIRDGELSESVFAADIGDVMNNKASIEYSDATTFFQRTYMTNGLKSLIDTVINRLSSGRGDPAIQLQTPFGGGKTHALLSLYHIINSDDTAQLLLPGITKPRDSKVVVFAGTQEDALRGRTPWGEIAYQLGTYSIVKEHDEKRVTPGRKLINKMLGDKPLLIIIDELGEYLVKAKGFREQVVAFAHELTEEVKSKHHCCVVYALPSSAPYDDTGVREKALSDLQQACGRIDTIYSPVGGDERYEVIRKRLFDDLGDEMIRKQVAQKYFDLYKKLDKDVPSDVKTIQYREKMERAYPFHPELLDVLYERWGSYYNFHRTRGVLKLLANVVHDLYSRKIVSPLIQSSLINLGNESIKRELIRYTGNEYDSIIDSDIAGKDAKAPRIDKQIGSEYEKYEIASCVARTVFMYSFSGGKKSGITAPWIRVSLLNDVIPHTIVGDAVDRLEEELWYFHSEQQVYSFKNQPNINRVIIDRENTITEAEITETIRNLTKKCCGRSMDIYLWPEKQQNIPDNKKLKLAILSPELSSKEHREDVELFFNKSGDGLRTYKNTLYIVALDDSQLFVLMQSCKKYLALKSINEDQDFMDGITKEGRRELQKKLKDLETDLPSSLMSAYKILLRLTKEGVSWKDLGILTEGTTSISERIIRHLKDSGIAVPVVSASFILDKAMSSDESEKLLSEIYDYFLKTPGECVLLGESVLISAVEKGVKEGACGLRSSTGSLYWKEVAAASMDSKIVRPEVAQKEIGKPKDTGGEGDGSRPDPAIPPKIPVNGDGETSKKIKRFVLKAKVPWDKISSVISGVIRPLREKGNPPEVRIDIEAKTDGEFDRTTLDLKIKETLKQIHAEIEEWEELRQ